MKDGLFPRGPRPHGSAAVSTATASSAVKDSQIKLRPGSRAHARLRSTRPASARSTRFRPAPGAYQLRVLGRAPERRRSPAPSYYDLEVPGLRQGRPGHERAGARLGDRRAGAERGGLPPRSRTCCRRRRTVSRVGVPSRSDTTGHVVGPRSTTTSGGTPHTLDITTAVLEEKGPVRFHQWTCKKGRGRAVRPSAADRSLHTDDHPAEGPRSRRLPAARGARVAPRPKRAREARRLTFPPWPRPRTTGG
jgi:hypothetical protein